MTEERRRFIRIDKGIDFSYKIRASQDLMEKAVTKNISPGGIRALVNKAVKKGTWLELRLYLPTLKDPIPCTTKVIWTADEKEGRIDVGIKFEEIDPEMKNKFLEYICGLMFSELQRLRM